MDEKSSFACWLGGVSRHLGIHCAQQKKPLDEAKARFYDEPKVSCTEPEIHLEPPLKTEPSCTTQVVDEILPGQMEEPADGDAESIENALKLLAPVNNLLDDGEHLQALYRCRAFLLHPDREVRRAALNALRWIGLPAALDMAEMTDDVDEEIRALAQQAFWETFDQEDRANLKRNLLGVALNSKDSDVRMRALDELVFLPDALSYGLLVGALNDSDSDVAERAKEKLCFITGKDLSTLEQLNAWHAENQARLETEYLETLERESSDESF